MDFVELTFKYTQSEYVKAEREYLIGSKTIRKFDAALVAILLPLSAFYLLFSSFSIVSIVLLGVVLLALMVGCALYFYIPAYKFKQTSKYHEEYHLIFSKDSVKFKTPSIDSELKWDIYSQLWESDTFYFLIQSPRVYSIIPKRAFGNQEEMQAFEEIVLSNLKSAKRTL